MILLLENKQLRQKKFEIKNISKIDNILGDEKCNEIISNFLKDNSIFNKYDTIIIHESIYFEEKRAILFETLKKYSKSKNLVIFSGSRDTSSLNKNILEISAKTMYVNLEDFINEYNNNHKELLILAYGKLWKFNFLLNILEKLNIFIDENFENDIELDFDEFEDDFDLFKIKEHISQEDYENIFSNIDDYEDEITLEQIIKLRDNLKKLIKVD